MRGAKKVEKEPLEGVRALEVAVLKALGMGVVGGVTSIASVQVESSTTRMGSQSRVVGRCEKASIETQGRTAKDAEPKNSSILPRVPQRLAPGRFLTFAIHHLNEPERGNYTDKMCHECVDICLNEKHI